MILALFAGAIGFSIYLEAGIRSLEGAIGNLRRDAAKVPASSRAQASRLAYRSTIQLPQIAEGFPPGGSQKWKPISTSTVRPRERMPSGGDYDLIMNAGNQFRTRLRFYELYEMLGLSEDQIALFENEAIERKLTFNEMITADSETATNHRQSQAKLMDQVVEKALGKDYVEPFRAFLETSDLRGEIAGFTTSLSGTNAALKPDQAAALLQACLEVRQSQLDATKIDIDDIDWDAVMTRSPEFLTSEQQKQLRSLIDRRNFDRMFRNVTGLPMHLPIRGLRPQ